KGAVGSCSRSARAPGATAVSRNERERAIGDRARPGEATMARGGRGWLRVHNRCALREQGTPRRLGWGNARRASGAPSAGALALQLLRRPVPGLGLRSEEHTSELQSRENLVC